MTVKRWAQQDTYATAIESHAADNGVPTELAYGLIAQESGFNANAIRQEPTYKCAATGVTGDASYGLVQVLYCTARSLGYTGTPGGLFDVETNVQLGMTLFGQLLRSHRGDVAAALSAYNGGDRPALGYGARRADGTFANQQYVDNILNNANYFLQYLAARDGDTTDAGGAWGGPTYTQDTGGSTDDSSSGISPLAIAVGILGGGALWFAIVRALRH